VSSGVWLSAGGVAKVSPLAAPAVPLFLGLSAENARKGAGMGAQDEAWGALLQDWRELKLEREVWRSLDLLSQSRQSLSFRRKYYADLFEPTALTSKVST
jgi:hypothetical protein